MRPDAPRRLLSQLADLLSTTVSGNGTDLVVGARFWPDGIDLHLHPGEGHCHLAEVLCGFDAPDDWDAIGVAARGRAVRLPERRSRGVAPRPGARSAQQDHADPYGRAGSGRPLAAAPVVVVHLQARTGPSRSVVGPPGGPFEAMSGPPAGRLADLCRRCLGLATAPPAMSVLHWWAAQWLDRLAGEPGLESARHEPDLVASFPGGAPFGPSRDLAALEHHGRLLEASCPWPALRQAAAAGAIAVTGIDAGAADWMDDGMFARWAMTEAPSCRSGLAEVRERLEAGLADRLEHLLHRWDVLDPDRPGTDDDRAPAP